MGGPDLCSAGHGNWLRRAHARRAFLAARTCPAHALDRHPDDRRRSRLRCGWAAQIRTGTAVCSAAFARRPCTYGTARMIRFSNLVIGDLVSAESPLLDAAHG